MVVANPIPKKKILVTAVMASMLADDENQTVEATRGELSLSRNFEFEDKFPAQELDLEAPNASRFRVRIVISPERVNQVIVAGSSAFVEGKDAKWFVGSFKILE